MITLLSYRDREQRLRHTLKHFYNLRERFWDVAGAFLSWLNEWNTLRALGVLGEEGAVRVAPGTAADALVNDGHARWHGIAQRACEQALSRDQVRPARAPGRKSFVGEAGVLVIAAPAGAVYQLVTCFRVVPGWTGRSRSDPAAWEAAAIAKAERESSAAQGAIERTAVRRSRRAALYGQEPQGTGHDLDE